MKRIFVLTLILMVTLVAIASASQTALAAGSPFNTLIFPGSSATSCGTWQASGLGGLADTKWFAFYSLTDGDGNLLYAGWLSRIPASGSVSGRFWRRPARNPIHFQAFTSFNGPIYNIGNIRMDDPCRSSSGIYTATPKASATYLASPLSLTWTNTPATPFIPSPTRPGPTFIPGTGTALPLQILVPQLPYGTIGCSSAGIGGTLASIKAPYIRATVSLGADLNQTIATQVLPLTDPHYNITLSYPTQPVRTHLVVAVGQWDGTKYVEPTALLAGDCLLPTQPAPTSIFTPTQSAPQPSPTVYNASQPQIAGAYIGCAKAMVTGTVPTSNAPYLLVTIRRASDFQPLATRVIPLSTPFNAELSYPLQAPGSTLVLAVGLWDGNNYLSGLSLYDANCVAPTTGVPTVAPTSIFTPTQLAPPPSPTIYSANLPQITAAYVGCASATVSGTIYSKSAYLLVTIKRASDFQSLATEFILRRTPFNAELSYPLQAPGTALVLAVGLWDGVNYLSPLSLYNANCVSPTPVAPTVAPTSIPTTRPYNPPKIIGEYIGCTSAIISGTVDATTTAQSVHVELRGNEYNFRAVYGDQVVPIINHSFIARFSYPLLPPDTAVEVDVDDATGGTVDGGNCIAPTVVAPTSTVVPSLTSVAGGYYVRYTVANKTGTCTNTSWYIPTIYVAANTPTGTVLHIVERSGNTVFRNYTGIPDSRPYVGSSINIGIASGFSLTQPYTYMTTTSYSLNGAVFSLNTFTVKCANDIATETIINQ